MSADWTLTGQPQGPPDEDEDDQQDGNLKDPDHLDNDAAKEQDCFKRAAQEDEDDTNDFNIAGPRVVADVVLARIIGGWVSSC